MALWLSQGAIFYSEEIREVTLFFLKFIPRIIDEFEEHTVHHFRMDKSKFATSKRSQSTDERITFGLQLIHGCFGAVHIQPDDHDAFAPFFNKLGHVTIRGGGFHQFESHFAQPVPCYPDFLELIHIGIIRSSFQEWVPRFFALPQGPLLQYRCDQSYLPSSDTSCFLTNVRESYLQRKDFPIF